MFKYIYIYIYMGVLFADVYASWCTNCTWRCFVSRDLFPSIVFHYKTTPHYSLRGTSDNF